MIFVTVGTHEQQFNRLIKSIDEIALKLNIGDDILIQTGYSNYVPVNCKHEKFIEYEKMNDYLEKSKLVISHGGPSTFMIPIMNNVSTIIVPRSKEHGEHVNDHQLEFCEEIVNMFNFKLVRKIDELELLIQTELNVYQDNTFKIELGENRKFTSSFESEVKKLIQK